MSDTGKTISPNAKDALALSLKDGDISQESHEIMVQNLDTMALYNVQHVSPDDMSEDRVTLVIPVIDCTGSRRLQADLMREEYNKMLRAFEKSSEHETILVSGWLFGARSKLLHGFVHLQDAVRLDTANYNPDGETALFDAVLDVATITQPYVKTLVEAGWRVKVVVAVLTDGEDNSSRNSVDTVRRVVEDLLKQEIYVFGLTAFGTGFGQEAAEAMGFPKKNVAEFGRDEQGIRHGFELNSSSVIRQSQTQIGDSTSFFN